MLTKIFDEISHGCPSFGDRQAGTALLKTAKLLHRLAGVSYLALNIPDASGAAFRHCLHTDATSVRKRSEHPLPTDLLSGLGPSDPGRDGRQDAGGIDTRSFYFPLTPYHGETAVFSFAIKAADLKAAHKVRDHQGPMLFSDIRILAQYFHKYTLRMNGSSPDTAPAISGRELDCLRWTAAGKTAWEASVILGISERTVRFHLNAAREKMKCATTTQAVAKAVAQDLIAF